MGFALDTCNLNALSEYRLITLTGAGGKTSLSHLLGSLFKSDRKRIITTTTTKILPPDRGHIVLQADGPDFMGRVRAALDIFSCITVARDYDTNSGKLLGLTPETVSVLYRSGIADNILVEGDGAARKPLKAPAAHEPVVPAETDLCIGVMGIDAVYRTMSEGCVHRGDIFSQITGCHKGDIITPHHLITLAGSARGLFKECPDSCPKIAFLNKTDSPGGAELTAEFIRLLSGKIKTEVEWFAGSVREKEIYPLLNFIPQPSLKKEMQLAFS